MSTGHPLVRYLTQSPVAACTGYIVLVLICAVVTWSAWADVYERYGSLAATTRLLDRMQASGLSPGRAASLGGSAPAGSPFLEGASITFASAALQQRVTDAVTKPGGNVLSSQVDLTGAAAKAGLISLIVSCELDQPSLQQALYDLEAGMPFLFIDQLEVQSPQATGREGGPMRVLMTVSGQWQGGK